MEYRVEKKYLITDKQIAYIRERLKEVMQPDINMTGDSYLIRSIYFDDLYDSCLAENEAGINERAKYRIRTYNNSQDVIRLERKSKKNGYTKKESALISKELSDKYINCHNHPSEVLDIELEKDIGDNSLIRRLWMEGQTRLLSPVIIVEYERMAFVEPVGNVRITFDCNIGATGSIDRFYEDNLDTVPILPKGQHILEVKYDEFLPEYIYEIINIGCLSRTSYSKYYYARRPVNI